MTVNLAHITFDCADPIRLAGFWSAALGLPVDEGAGEFFVSIGADSNAAPVRYFIKVPEPKSAKNRVHVDLAAADRAAYECAEQGGSSRSRTGYCSVRS